MICHWEHRGCGDGRVMYTQSHAMNTPLDHFIHMTYFCWHIIIDSLCLPYELSLINKTSLTLINTWLINNFVSYCLEQQPMWSSKNLLLTDIQTEPYLYIHMFDSINNYHAIQVIRSRFVLIAIIHICHMHSLSSLFILNQDHQ